MRIVERVIVRAADQASPLERCAIALRTGSRPAAGDVLAAIEELARTIEPKTDRIALRKRLLRTAWHGYLPGVPRCRAARILAARWKVFADTSKPADWQAIPDTIEYLFDRLEQAGVTPRGIGTLIVDLDATLD